MGERKLLPKEVTHPKAPRYARQLDSMPGSTLPSPEGPRGRPSETQPPLTSLPAL